MSVLYVVFHGEIVFFDSCKPEDGIQAYAPEMDIHVYSAGPWLAEHMIPKGLKLKLDGVNSGSATLDDYRKCMLVYQNAAKVDEKINSLRENHMQIELGRPDLMFSGSRIPVTGVKVSPPQSVTPPPDSCNALCTVFQYNSADRPQLSIDGTFGGGKITCPGKLCWRARRKSGRLLCAACLR